MEQTVPKMLKDSAGKWPEIPAQYFKNAAGTFINLTRNLGKNIHYERYKAEKTI